MLQKLQKWIIPTLKLTVRFVCRRYHPQIINYQELGNQERLFLLRKMEIHLRQQKLMEVDVGLFH